jgi:hypothetical protein
MTVVEPMGRGNDLIGVDGGLGVTLDNRLLHDCHRVFGQQLKDTHILPRSGEGAVTALKGFPQTLEAGRQRPTIEHGRMIQSRRSATENGQIVTGLDDPFVPCITSCVRGDDAIGPDHIDPVNIRLDRHRSKGPATGNAVAIGVESHRLILVDLGRGWDKRIERMGRQRQCRLFVLLK